MNRQARHYGEVTWFDVGAMGFVAAAELFAGITMGNGETRAEIQVRDSSTPDDIKTFTVERCVSYVVTNPRQGA